MKILTYPSLRSSQISSGCSKPIIFWCQVIIPASLSKFLSTFLLLHLKQTTCYFLNISANSTPKCLFVTFDYLTTLAEPSKLCPTSLRWSPSHIPGKESFSLCVTTGLCLCFHRFYHTLHSLFAFLFFLHLNFPAWHPPIFSPWWQGYVISLLWISKIWHSS